MNAALAPIRDAKTILLTTYKRDGTAVATPVSVAFDGDRAFFRSYDKAWKTKRLRRNPAVQAAPATLRGKPAGPTIQARAHCSTTSRHASPPGHWRAGIASCRPSWCPWKKHSRTQFLVLVLPPFFLCRTW